MNERPDGFAPQREIFIAVPPDLSDTPHFQCMRNHLLIAQPVRLFCSVLIATHKTNISRWARAAHGKFLHFDYFWSRGAKACARRKKAAVGETAAVVFSDAKKDVPVQMHAEQRQSEADSQAVRGNTRSAAPTSIWRSQQVPHLPR